MTPAERALLRTLTVTLVAFLRWLPSVLSMSHENRTQLDRQHEKIIAAYKETQ